MITPTPAELDALVADLVDYGSTTPWHFASRCLAAADAIRSLRRDLEEVREKYNELIYQVGNKFPEETRHETALRYLRNAERMQGDLAQTARPIDAAKELKP
jgi:seryl-tRNA synthetase